MNEFDAIIPPYKTFGFMNLKFYKKLKKKKI